MSRKHPKLNFYRLFTANAFKHSSPANNGVLSKEAIGKLLKEKREGKAESLAAVSKKTRIHSNHLTAFEAGKSNTNLPSPTEGQFLREYAAYLGFETDEIERMIKNWRGGVETQRAPQPITRSNKQTIFLLLSVITVLLLFAGVFVFLQYIRSNPINLLNTGEQGIGAVPTINNPTPTSNPPTATTHQPEPTATDAPMVVSIAVETNTVEPAFISTLTATDTPTGLVPAEGITNTIAPTFTPTLTAAVALTAVMTSETPVSATLQLSTTVTITSPLTDDSSAAVASQTTSTATIPLTPTLILTITDTPTATPTPQPLVFPTATPIPPNQTSGFIETQFGKDYLDLQVLESGRPLVIEMTTDPPDHPALGKGLNVYIAGENDGKWEQVIGGCHPQTCNTGAGDPNVAAGKIVVNITQPVDTYHVIVVNDSQQPAQYTLVVQNGEFPR